MARNLVCKYYKCYDTATTSYAGASVCQNHFNLVMEETRKYYNKRISSYEREYYNDIEKFTIWGNKNNLK